MKIIVVIMMVISCVFYMNAQESNEEYVEMSSNEENNPDFIRNEYSEEVNIDGGEIIEEERESNDNNNNEQLETTSEIEENIKEKKHNDNHHESDPSVEKVDKNKIQDNNEIKEEIISEVEFEEVKIPESKEKEIPTLINDPEIKTEEIMIQVPEQNSIKDQESQSDIFKNINQTIHENEQNAIEISEPEIIKTQETESIQISDPEPAKTPEVIPETIKYLDQELLKIQVSEPKTENILNEQIIKQSENSNNNQKEQINSTNNHISADTHSDSINKEFPSSTKANHKILIIAESFLYKISQDIQQFLPYPFNLILLFICGYLFMSLFFYVKKSIGTKDANIMKIENKLNEIKTNFNKNKEALKIEPNEIPITMQPESDTESLIDTSQYDNLMNDIDTKVIALNSQMKASFDKHKNVCETLSTFLITTIEQISNKNKEN